MGVQPLSLEDRIEIVDPDPVRIPYDKVKYHQMTSSKYCEFRGQNSELE